MNVAIDLRKRGRSHRSGRALQLQPGGRAISVGSSSVDFFFLRAEGRIYVHREIGKVKKSEFGHTYFS